MNSSFFNSSFFVIFIIIAVVTLCFSSVFTTLSESNNEIIISNGTVILPENIYFTNSKFLWPTPGYTTITSYFGYRNAPTQGASTYHSGIDIGAPVGTNIIAVTSGTVTYTGFYAAGGYTVTVKSDNLTISYCHVSPQFLVCTGQYVTKGSVIATVGPRNVYGVPNNPYKDSNGNPTNGASTGPHLHLTIKKDGQAVNPLDYISSSSS